MEQWLALAVFVVTFAAIIVEKVHKTLVALAGALAMLLLGLISQEHLLEEGPERLGDGGPGGGQRTGCHGSPRWCAPRHPRAGRPGWP